MDKKVLGIIWNKDITEYELRSFLVEINKEKPLNEYELAIYSIDRESAVKYGMWDSLACTRLLATASYYIVNFYIEYDTDRLKLLKQLVEYVANHQGELVLINPSIDTDLSEIRKLVNEHNCVTMYVMGD